jgi:L-threonylcarbamoyladenylate synthase
MPDKPQAARIVPADPAAIAEAAALLRAGSLVAVPTETVYGLAARPTAPQPWRRSTAPKGAPISIR